MSNANSVKANPLDTTARILLADLLCLQGALERADAQLRIASHHALDDAIGITQLCGLIRAEGARPGLVQGWRATELPRPAHAPTTEGTATGTSAARRRCQSNRMPS